jgi:predicted component of type VI protein secretion system
MVIALVVRRRERPAVAVVLARDVEDAVAFCEAENVRLRDVSVHGPNVLPPSVDRIRDRRPSRRRRVQVDEAAHQHGSAGQPQERAQRPCVTVTGVVNVMPASRVTATLSMPSAITRNRARRRCRVDGQDAELVARPAGLDVAVHPGLAAVVGAQQARMRSGVVYIAM